MSILEQILQAEEKLTKETNQALDNKQQLIEKTKTDTEKEIELMYQEVTKLEEKLVEETNQVLEIEEKHFKEAMSLIEEEVKEKTKTKVKHVVNIIISEVKNL